MNHDPPKTLLSTLANGVVVVMENLKNILQFAFVCIFILYTFNFARDLILKNKNFEAVIEWVSRGYCFGIGLFMAVGLLILIINIFQK